MFFVLSPGPIGGRHGQPLEYQSVLSDFANSSSPKTLTHFLESEDSQFNVHKKADSGSNEPRRWT